MQKQITSSRRIPFSLDIGGHNFKREPRCAKYLHQCNISYWEWAVHRNPYVEVVDVVMICVLVLKNSFALEGWKWLGRKLAGIFKHWTNSPKYWAYFPIKLFHDRSHTKWSNKFTVLSTRIVLLHLWENAMTIKSMYSQGNSSFKW